MSVNLKSPDPHRVQSEMQQLLHDCFSLRSKSYSDVENAINGTMYAVATVNIDGKIVPESAVMSDGKTIPMLYFSQEEAFRQERKLLLQHFEWYEDFSSDHKAVAVRWNKDNDCLMFFEVGQKDGDVGRYLDSLNAASFIL